MMRLRIWWISPNISSSFEKASASIPYPFSALGVDPPDWSSAAMKPCREWSVSSVLASCMVSKILSRRWNDYDRLRWCGARGPRLGDGLAAPPELRNRRRRTRKGPRTLLDSRPPHPR